MAIDVCATKKNTITPPVWPKPGGGGGGDYTPGLGIQISAQGVISAVMNQSNTYTKAQVDAIVAAIRTAHLETVFSLPATGDENTIYLLKKDDGYDMYLYIGEEWILIGDTEIDLSNYYTKDETDAIADTLEALATQAQTTANAAQQASDAAQSAADTAQTAANAANSNANTAKTAADAAQNTADSANELAQTAYDLANAKQDPLSNGNGIQITDNVISVKANEIFTTKGGVLSNQTLGAGARKAFAIPINPPSGYSIGGYRQISIANASSGGANADKCFLQWFSTTGGGTSAQVSVYNNGTSDAVIDITVTCLLVHT